MNNNKKSRGSQFSTEETTKLTESILVDYFDNQQKEKWNQILIDKYGIKSPQKKRAKRIRLFSRFAAAATLLLFITIGIFHAPFNSTNSTQELLAIHLKDKKQGKNSKKSIEIVEHIETDAMVAYEENDYKSAIPLFVEIIEKKEIKIENYLLLGLSYLYNQNTQQAVEALKTARTIILTSTQNNTAEMASEINWYLSLAYLQDKDYKNAKKELTAIIENNGWKKEAAEELLASKSLSKYRYK